MEKFLNKMDKRVKENSKASAFGGFKKVLGWMLWAVSKVLAWLQVELTALDGSIDKADSPKQVFRDMKDDKLGDLNKEIRKYEKLLAKAQSRMEKALEEKKENKAERYFEKYEEYEAKLIQLDRVKKALVKKA